MKMHSKRRTAIRFTMLAIATTVALSACGFQLRGSGGRANLPFATLHLGFPDTSSLGNELKRNIRSGSGTTLVADPKAAEASVELLSETREKLTLTLNTQGRVREYSLLYKVNFQVRDAQGKELLAPTEIVLKRDISFNESQVMAKEKEEELLYRDMQSDLVQQIMRRLAALKRV
jgi:LPS-assembly lipoprotein